MKTAAVMGAWRSAVLTDYSLESDLTVLIHRFYLTAH
jgi:hypothetical protein